MGVVHHGKHDFVDGQIAVRFEAVAACRAGGALEGCEVLAGGGAAGLAVGVVGGVPWAEAPGADAGDGEEGYADKAAYAAAAGHDVFGYDGMARYIVM
mmetsp:Transcript_29429/g.61898  ORF Transcript_29429/g.61898 Transcript_29429/m.61898 type:complete len:98 (+) Transcript_29429:987-1280(+)